MISAGIIFMEYISDHETFNDLPFERIFSACRKAYPDFQRILVLAKINVFRRKNSLQTAGIDDLFS
jgi:hypothetical protein